MAKFRKITVGDTIYEWVVTAGCGFYVKGLPLPDIEWVTETVGYSMKDFEKRRATITPRHVRKWILKSIQETT